MTSSAPDLGLDITHSFFDVVGHVPIRLESGNLVQKALQHRAPLRRVGYFGVELHAVESSRFVRHCGDRRSGVARDDLEAGRQLRDLVPVAHPDVEQTVTFRVAAILNVSQQARMPARAHFRVAELAHSTVLDLSAELRGHRLHAIANTEHRHTQLEHRLRRARRAALVHRVMAAGQDDGARRELAHERVGNVVRMDLAVDVRFAHAARDELRVLRAEVEDQNFVVQGAGRRDARARCRFALRRGRATLHSSRFTLHVASFDTIVGRFLDDLHVVHVGLAHAGRGDLDELGALRISTIVGQPT